MSTVSESSSLSSGESARLAYSVSELAAITGLKRSKLFEDIARGRGPRARRYDRRIIILREDALAWLALLPVVEPDPAAL